MALKPLQGFINLQTHHCVTGSMRHIYFFNNHDISEDLLLGIGAGVGFIYWHTRGQDPFLGGRGGTRPPYMEELAGQRTGVRIQRFTTSSARKARRSMLEVLDQGQPLLIFCDMGFLPYFDFGGQEYHFGQHAVVVCGYDDESQQVLIADRDDILHPISIEYLEKARSSTYKPFPPHNLWFTFDFAENRLPDASEVRRAIEEQVQVMLSSPIRNIGVAGIYKAAEMIPRWGGILDKDALRRTCFNAYIFIDAQGGSGGGLFRLMFGRFLREAAGLASESRLVSCALDFAEIGKSWDRVGNLFRQVSEGPDPAAGMTIFKEPLLELAEREQAAWLALEQIVRG